MRKTTRATVRKLATALGLSLGLPTGAAQAALVTEVFTVTLPAASGPYGVGHVFEITATYDDAGTMYHAWNDGPDGKADFGQGDDTVSNTTYLSSTGVYTMFSNADMSIAGLLDPPSSTPRDGLNTNTAVVYDYGDPTSATGYRHAAYIADSILLAYWLYGSGYAEFALWQFYSGPSGAAQLVTQVSAYGVATRSFVSVPEPASLALLGLGLAGLAATRLRK